MGEFSGVPMKESVSADSALNDGKLEASSWKFIVFIFLYFLALVPVKKDKSEKKDKKEKKSKDPSKQIVLGNINDVTTKYWSKYRT